MIRLVLILTLLLVPVWAQVVPGRFIVELADEPAIASKGRLAAVRSSQDRVRQALAARPSVRVLEAVENVANAIIVEAASEAELAAIPGVKRVHKVRLFRKLLDRSVVLQKVTDAWTAIGGVENAGAGIKIGVIDTGIDAMHPGLQDSDMRQPEGYPKVQNNSDIGNTNNKVIVARNYDRRALGSARDTEGHGTGVAMIAAGRLISGPRGAISGVAPKAWLGNYKVFADNSETASSDGILRAIDDAVADGMDVINLSLGSFPAEPPSQDIFVTAVERATAAGVIVVIAAGNEGPSAATIGSPATAPSAIAVGNAFNDRVFASNVRVEGRDPILALPAQGASGRPAATASLRDVSTLDTTGLACTALPTDSLIGRVAFILRGTCTFEDKLNNAARAGAIGAIVYTHADSPSASTMAVGTATLPAVMISNADGLALKALLQTESNLVAMVNYSPAAIPVNPSRLSESSSKGPSVDARIKPEILGVGTSVYTADLATETAIGYQINSGTSFSSPMVAGVAAILKANRPGLSPQQYRSLLINSASPFSYDGTSPAPIQHTGAGMLNALAAVRATVAAAPQTLDLGSGTADVNQSVSLSLSNVGTADDTYALSVEPFGTGPAPTLDRNTLAVAAGKAETVRLTMEARGLTAGAYQGFVIARSSTSDAVARIPYWYGVPSKEVAEVSIIGPPEAGRRSFIEELLVRPTDATGFAVDERPTVTVVQGGGVVSSINRSQSFEGFWIVDVRLGPELGANVFDVSAGGKTTRVVIIGE